MQISPSITPVSGLATDPRFRAPAKGELALFDNHGVGFNSVRDLLTGYGRDEGYDSLANARRAAYMLSRGADRAAAGVFQQGDRFFVRALGSLPGVKPHAKHDETGPLTPTPDTKAAVSLLHFEGNTDAHFAWVRDARLVLMVDGATKVWARDAHHQPPTA